MKHFKLRLSFVLCMGLAGCVTNLHYKEIDRSPKMVMKFEFLDADFTITSLNQSAKYAHLVLWLGKERISPEIFSRTYKLAIREHDQLENRDIVLKGRKLLILNGQYKFASEDNKVIFHKFDYGKLTGVSRIFSDQWENAKYCQALFNFESSTYDEEFSYEFSHDQIGSGDFLLKNYCYFKQDQFVCEEYDGSSAALDYTMAPNYYEVIIYAESGVTHENCKLILNDSILVDLTASGKYPNGFAPNGWVQFYCSDSTVVFKSDNIHHPEFAFENDKGKNAYRLIVNSDNTMQIKKVNSTLASKEIDSLRIPRFEN
ncbi:MAG: hypothetical protein ACKVOK_08155 [Flavobacteriales bacterium]